MNALTRISVIVLATAMLPAAQAISVLRLSDGVTTVDIPDNFAPDANINPGFIQVSGPVGPNWFFNLTIALSKPFVGTPAEPLMHITSFNATSIGAGTLRIEFSDESFVAPAGPVDFFAAVGGVTQGDATFRFAADPGNILFAKTVVSAPLTGQDLDPGAPGTAFSFNEPLGFGPLNGLYSLTMEAAIRHLGPGQTSFDAELSGAPRLPPGGDLPEGGSTLVLLAASLLGFSIYSKKRI